MSPSDALGSPRSGLTSYLATYLGGGEESEPEVAVGSHTSGMSCTAVGDGQAGVCANCGRSSDGEGGLFKLKNCTACRLVKYCGVECQKAHRKIHKKACKKRSAE